MSDDDVLSRVQRALAGPADASVVPPVVHEPTARRVYSELGLPELFAHAARRTNMVAELIDVDGLAGVVSECLRQHGIVDVAVEPSALLRKVRLAESLVAGGFHVVSGGPAEAVITGCDAAVAETGSVVFRGRVPHGWTTARVRLAVLEPRNFVPDLIDLFAAHAGDLVLIAGPSLHAFVLH